MRTKRGRAPVRIGEQLPAVRSGDPMAICLPWRGGGACGVLIPAGACAHPTLIGYAFPTLQVLFPPLTYLQPTGRVQLVTVGENCFKVVEVTPNIP